MKRLLIGIILTAVLMISLSVRCSAADVSIFDEEVQKIENSVGGETEEDLEELNAAGVDDLIANGVDSAAVWSYLFALLREYAASPLSALVLVTAVLILASVAESYTYSLRYTETKDIMATAVSLFIASVMFSPVTKMVNDASVVIQGASSLMTVYLPAAIGILAFSGHAISSGGYYAAVLSASKTISWLASTVLGPLLSVILSLSVCAGISSRLKLGGLIEMLSKAFKYAVTFAMSIFVAIIGLNGAISGAADSVANKAARFTLSSFIPLIGSSISEAYGAVQSSVGVLRSGLGVFVILAVFVAFAPILIKTILWSFTLFAAKTIGEALSVSSAVGVLNALSQFTAALRTVLIAVMTVFIISSGIMMSLGGAS